MSDFQSLPFRVVFLLDDLEEKLSIFNAIVFEYMTTHATIKRTKITKSPTPWMRHLDNKSLKSSFYKGRYKSFEANFDNHQHTYVKLRNQLKSTIKESKNNFYKKHETPNNLHLRFHIFVIQHQLYYIRRTFRFDK